MVAKKSVLGRGLGALIDDTRTTTAGGGIYEIEIGNIELNPFQPRSKFDKEALAELASSIKELGIIQAITVKIISNGKYKLISGERRVRASKIAGLKMIPAYIRTADDQALLELSLVENIQREDLDSIEIAISYQRLIDECRLTQENLSNRVGKKRSTITNYLRLLKLPVEIQHGIRNNSISMGHARALINISEIEMQLAMYQDIIDKSLSVRKLEELVRSYMRKKTGIGKNETSSAKLDKNYLRLRDHLSKYFKSEIEFKRTTKGKGKIIIPFSSDDDLERILGIFDKLDS
ncbi:ParB/RepB/Spo0J family partition protein [Bacteroidota bacterium]